MKFKNITEKFCELGLDITLNTLSFKNVEKMDFIKILQLCSLKDIIKIMKRKATTGGKYLQIMSFLMDMLISRNFKEL